LIQRPEGVKALDDYNEQSKLNSPADVADTSSFDSQKDAVGSVIKDLDLGGEVHWPKIQRALYVPE